MKNGRKSFRGRKEGEEIPRVKEKYGDAERRTEPQGREEQRLGRSGANYRAGAGVEMERWGCA